MLKRKHARLCLILLGLAVLSLVCLALTAYVVKPEGLFWDIFWIVSVWFFMTATIISEILLLRCKNCGKTCTRPRWNPGETLYCPICGKPFVFDDDRKDKKHEDV